MNGKLILFRGLPASGKSTEADRLQQELLQAGVLAARVSRDGTRDLLHGARSQAKEAERQVTVAQHAAVEALLRDGVTVIVDDTNLQAQSTKDFMAIAVRAGAEFAINDECLAAPLEECIRRDAARDPYLQVGEAVIRDMHRRHLAQHKGRLPTPKVTAIQPAQRYQPVPGTPDSVLVDIDGTVALRTGSRSPYDMTRVAEDEPNHTVILAVRAMHAAGYAVIFCSGRDETARPDTEAWIAEHVQVPHLALHMRAKGDNRSDDIVKQEIFDREIREKYTVVGVFDDRAQVVRMWRGLGLTVFQVAEGDF